MLLFFLDKPRFMWHVSKSAFKKVLCMRIAWKLICICCKIMMVVHSELTLAILLIVSLSLSLIDYKLLFWLDTVARYWPPFFDPRGLTDLLSILLCDEILGGWICYPPIKLEVSGCEVVVLETKLLLPDKIAPFAALFLLSFLTVQWRLLTEFLTQMWM